jgi:hypothetical protein
MPPNIVWLSFFGGLLFMVFAWRAWAEGRREGSRWQRWDSVTFVTFATFALTFWLQAIRFIADQPMGVWWYTPAGALILVGIAAWIMGQRAQKREHRSRRQ